MHRSLTNSLFSECHCFLKCTLQHKRFSTQHVIYNQFLYCLSLKLRNLQALTGSHVRNILDKNIQIRSFFGIYSFFTVLLHSFSFTMLWLSMSIEVCVTTVNFTLLFINFLIKKSVILFLLLRHNLHALDDKALMIWMYTKTLATEKPNKQIQKKSNAHYLMQTKTVHKKFNTLRWFN